MHFPKDTKNDRPSADYRQFSQSFVQATIGSPADITQSYLKEAKAHLDNIEEEYKKIFDVRVDIDNPLKGFKQKLCVKKTTQLFVCFKRLRRLVGNDKTLQLSQEGQLHIVIGEDACEDAKEAVEQFNLMLQRCSEYPEKQNEAEAIIEREIVALERDSVQTQATLDAQQRARTQLSALREWGEEVQNIIEDTKSSAKHLLSKNEQFSI